MDINSITSIRNVTRHIWEFTSLISREPTEKGCRVWLGPYGSRYGTACIGGNVYSAHRVSYVFFVGEIPDGMFVLHKCDNPACVHPGHLFVGTAKDNQVDMALKGRSAASVRNGCAKITEETVMAIFNATGSQGDIAKRFRVAKATVCHIKSGRQWSSVTGKIHSFFQGRSLSQVAIESLNKWEP